MSFQGRLIVICCLTYPVCIGYRVMENTEQRIGFISKRQSTSDRPASASQSRTKMSVGSVSDVSHERLVTAPHDAHLQRQPSPPRPAPERSNDFSARMDLREHRLFHLDVSLDCCPTTTEQTQRATAVNWHGIIIELLQTDNFTHSFYETVCRPEFKDHPCQYVDPRLASASRCVQQYNYAYAFGRPFGTDEQFRVELVRVASGCKCRLMAAALRELDELETVAESARERHAVAQNVDRNRAPGRPIPATGHQQRPVVDALVGSATGGNPSPRRQNVGYAGVGGGRRRGHRPASAEVVVQADHSVDSLQSYQEQHTEKQQQQQQQQMQQHHDSTSSDDISSFLESVAAYSGTNVSEEPTDSEKISEDGITYDRSHVKLLDAVDADSHVIDVINRSKGIVGGGLPIADDGDGDHPASSSSIL